jgi:alpha-tubulin suppressor-like RCC1 family protein
MVKTSRPGNLVLLAISIGLVLECSNWLHAAGVPFSFGWNEGGRTGLGTDMGLTPIATRIDTTNLGGKSVKQIAANTFHSLLVTEDGSVFSFGLNELGITGLGIGSGSTLVATPINTTNLGGRKIVKAAAGEAHSLLLAEDGTVFSFGANTFGRTGLGTATGNTLVPTLIDTMNLGAKKVADIAAGDFHSLLLTEDGTVFSFGWNDLGETGQGTTSGNTLVATPINTLNITGKKFIDVEAGGKFSLILSDDGHVYSFGNNVQGKTGLGMTDFHTVTARPIVTTNLGDRRIVQLAAGVFHSLLLAEDGTVFSFGGGSHGKTGLGTFFANTPIATPIDTQHFAGKRITQIDAGLDHSLLLAEDGSVFTFGSNQRGEGGRSGSFASISLAFPIDRTNLRGLHVIGIAAGKIHSLLLVVPEPTGATLFVACLVVGAFHRERRR